MATSTALDARLLRFRSRITENEACELAEALMQAGRIADSLDVISAGLSHFPEKPELLILEGQAWLRDGDVLRAQASLLRAARVAPHDPSAFRWLGEVLLRRGDPQRAEKVLERARALSPGSDEIRKLYERAIRLAKIAETTDGEKSEGNIVEDAEDTDSILQQPTVVRRDLMDRMVSKTRGEPEVAPSEAVPLEKRAAAKPAMPALLGVGRPSRTLSFEEEQEEDIPTNTVGDVIRANESETHEDSEDGTDTAFWSRPQLAGNEAPSQIELAATEPSAWSLHSRPTPEVQTDYATARASADDEEDVDAILQMLQREGIFEAPTEGAATWAPKAASKTRGTPIGVVLGVVWVVALALAGGGYYGWNQWIARRHAKATQLIREAQREAISGDHKDLVAAERQLREARELNAHDRSGPELLLFVHAQRALEDGAFEAGYIRPTIARGRAMKVSPAYLQAAEAVLSATEGRSKEAIDFVQKVLKEGKQDAAMFYVVGRLQQRLGVEEALPHLEQAVKRNPDLVAASIALAEAKADDGAPDQALALLASVLQHAPNHLRARLWKAFLLAYETDIDEGLHHLDELNKDLKVGAPTDHVLSDLVRSRLLRRKGDAAGAEAAIEHAVRAGATEPRLLALLASEAKALGKLDRAQHAAMQAASGAPSNTDFRKLLAEILIARRDGVRALATLGAFSNQDPDVLRLSAHAALLVDSNEALRETAKTLTAFVAEHGNSNAEMRALLLRTRASLGDAPQQLLEEAKALNRAVPGDPVVLRALTETALTARDASTAKDAGERLAKVSATDADSFFLLGRARRMSGDAAGAEESFRQALDLNAEHADASVALGSLLLDRGKFEDADRMYQSLVTRGGAVSGTSTSLLGRVGRIEALLGMGKVNDAAVQLDAIRSADRTHSRVRVVSAKVAIARGKAGEAVTLLRPLVESEQAPAEILATFGDALQEAGEAQASGTYYERALHLDANLPEALVGEARLLVRAENAKDAITYLERADAALDNGRIRPPSLRATVLFLMGRAYIQKRDLDHAAEALREATSIDGAPKEVWFYLGEALARKNTQESKAAYSHYLEVDPEGPYAARATKALR